ncbi:TonB-dependent receptor [Pedobacter sp. ASV12]|uniref:TonB-dependent receptor n=1 Tax=Pedobacter sp. ASV12 TaxID=2795120 RepID=UPI0018EB9778|nr:TonB-dependent receptor [Pedobacter sp. ASV12]
MKCQRLYFLLSFLPISLWTPGNSAAQVRIKGNVTTITHKAVPFASVGIKGSYDGTTADSTGKFHFTTSERGLKTLLVKAMGYETDSLTVDLNKPVDSLQFRLTEKSNSLNTVTIGIGSFVSGIQGKGISLNALDIATTPGMAADIFGAMQTLPGAQMAFGESGLLVRGGSTAETKTFIDGMLMKNPINAQVQGLSSRARLSAFNFRSTDFSTSGYAAQFGQALSSVLSLQTNNIPEKTSTTLRLLSVGVEAQQNINLKNSGLVLTGSYYNLKPNYTYLNPSQIDWIKPPATAAIGAQFMHRIGETGMFKYYMDYSDSKLGLNRATPNSMNDFAVVHNKNSYLNTTYQDALSPLWRLETGIAYSYTKDDIKIQLGNVQRLDQLLQLRAVAIHNVGKLSLIRFGAETFYTNRGESLNGLSRSYQDQLSAVFAETDLYLSRKLAIRAGLRGEYSSYLAKSNLSPRISCTYKLNSYTQAGLGYGRYFQSPADEYLLRSKLDFQTADSYVGNFEYKKSGYNFRFEAYFKAYGHLIKTADGLFNNNGDGYAKGFDLFWRDKESMKDSEYRIGYSFLDTKRNYLDYPTLATPGFASKHTFNIFYRKYFGDIKTQLNAGYVFATGRTYYNPKNPHFLADKSPNYHDISVNANYITTLFKQLAVVYVNVGNVLGLRQIYGYNYTADGTVRTPITPSTKRNIILGLIITIGDNTFYN